MIELVLICLIIIMASFGFVSIISAIGYWSTSRVRLEHQRESFKLNEQAKMNAINIAEKDMDMAERRMELMERNITPTYK